MIMTADIHYYYSTRHPRKPIRIEVTIYDDGGEMAVLDVHGRFASQREASIVGRSIGARFDEYHETFGRITTESEPPQIEEEEEQ
jgi:hypothetical protein